MVKLAVTLIIILKQVFIAFTAVLYMDLVIPLLIKPMEF